VHFVIKTTKQHRYSKEKRHTAEIYCVMMKIWKYQKHKFEQSDDCVLTSGLSKNHMGQMHGQPRW